MAGDLQNGRVRTSRTRVLDLLRLSVLTGGAIALVSLGLAVVDEGKVLDVFRQLLDPNDPDMALASPFGVANTLALFSLVTGIVIGMHLLLVRPARLAFALSAAWSVANLGIALLTLAPTASAMNRWVVQPSPSMAVVVAGLVIGSAVCLVASIAGIALAPSSLTFLDRYRVTRGLPPETHQA
jgi:hypothetical protein